MGADRLLVCSFYFYYTPERPVCQGLFSGLTFFAECGILEFKGIPETVGGLFQLPEGSEWYGIRNLVRFDSVQYPDRCYYSIDARYFP